MTRQSVAITLFSTLALTESFLSFRSGPFRGSAAIPATRPWRATSLSSTSPLPPSETAVTAPTERLSVTGAISMSISELSQLMGGTGRAKIVWDCYKIGVDPQNLFDPAHDGTPSLHQDDMESIVPLLPSSRRKQKLGDQALLTLASLYASARQVEGGVATLSHLSTSADGTTKMLLRLHDGLQVETVIIPVDGRSTLCVSSQVGCRQGESHTQIETRTARMVRLTLPLDSGLRRHARTPRMYLLCHGSNGAATIPHLGRNSGTNVLWSQNVPHSGTAGYHQCGLYGNGKVQSNENPGFPCDSLSRQAHNPYHANLSATHSG